MSEGDWAVEGHSESLGGRLVQLIQHFDSPVFGVVGGYTDTVSSIFFRGKKPFLEIAVAFIVKISFFLSTGQTGEYGSSLV